MREKLVNGVVTALGLIIGAVLTTEQLVRAMVNPDKYYRDVDRHRQAMLERVRKNG